MNTIDSCISNLAFNNNELFTGSIQQENVCCKCKSLGDIYGVENYYSEDDAFKKDIQKFCFNCILKYRIQNPLAHILTESFGVKTLRKQIQSILQLDAHTLIYNWTE